NSKSKNDWLSSDEQEVEKFEKDPYTGFLVSNQLIFETVKYMLQTSKLKNIKKMKSGLPILLISGKDDAIGNYGKGIRHLGKLYKKGNIQHITVHLYKNQRHE
ncbi:alpha/beta hydrolase, partial [bacterium M00.F.Ca.ET.199.01.1.1]